MRHVRAEFGFEIGFQLSANSSLTAAVHNRQTGVTMATSFGNKIATNHSQHGSAELL